MEVAEWIPVKSKKNAASEPAVIQLPAIRVLTHDMGENIYRFEDAYKLNFTDKGDYHGKNTYRYIPVGMYVFADDKIEFPTFHSGAFSQALDFAGKHGIRVGSFFANKDGTYSLLIQVDVSAEHLMHALINIQAGIWWSKQIQGHTE